MSVMREEMPRFSVTFGMGHQLAGRFWRVSAPNEEEARAKVFATFGNRWAFIYPDDEDFARQIEQYGLKEVTL